ncbi:MAG: hypothetical protein LBG79_05445 [Spirochaetaceae bacterium]|jgi:ABC-type antimicrobial peptide transport system permease subunit|nr:hypothetical protein [Spirochaetaceae bacterium]
MANPAVEILKENIAAIDASVKKLCYSYQICSAIGIKSSYSEDEFAAFEAMTSRYARTTDMLVNKILRNIDSVEYEDSGTIIDVMNRAEKREIVQSAELLHTLKDLRNNIAHEYKINEIQKFFAEVLQNIPFLLKTIDSANKYCEKYAGKTGA